MHVTKAVRCPVAPVFIRSVMEVAWRSAGGPAAARAGVPDVPEEISVRVTGDRELRRLNRSFLGLDEVTDVLSFPSGEPGYLGDLAVSWPAVVRQAAAYGHPEAVELALLCVHGLLHLLGRDHDTAAAERSMWAETRRCLAAAGVGPLGAERLPLRT